MSLECKKGAIVGGFDWCNKKGHSNCKGYSCDYFEEDALYVND
jgi:hypothetical protein